MKRSLLPIFLMIILLLLQYHLWFDKSGIIQIARLKQTLAKYTETNARLKKQNDTLLHQVSYLQLHQEAVESRARQDLGMIKKGERFYQVIPFNGSNGVEKN